MTFHYGFSTYNITTGYQKEGAPIQNSVRRIVPGQTSSILDFSNGTSEQFSLLSIEEDEDPLFWEEPDREDRYIRDYLYKMKHFDDHHPDDVYLSYRDFEMLELSLERLKRLQRTVGHGNFYLLNFDEALKIARNYTRVGRFTQKEIESTRYGLDFESLGVPDFAVIAARQLQHWAINRTISRLGIGRLVAKSLAAKIRHSGALCLITARLSISGCM